MVSVVDELKKKRAEIGLRISELRAQIGMLEQQQAAFDVVIRSYDPDHAPIAENGSPRRRRKLDGVDKGSISTLFKGFDRRGFVLRTLREAGRPITTADFAVAFARESGLGEDDARLGLIGNRFSQMLDQLAKADRVRRAGKVDGQRHLWEVAA